MANSMAFQLQLYSAAITISCAIGILLSAYSFYVETKFEQDNSYEAMCDISERISCTKVFTSVYGRGFGLIAPLLGEESIFNQPNGVLGVVFYSLIAILGLNNNIISAQLQKLLSAFSNLISLYSAYLLYFVIEDFCVVCVSLYAVNFANSFLTLNRYECLRAIKNDALNKSSRKKDE